MSHVMMVLILFAVAWRQRRVQRSRGHAPSSTLVQAGHSGPVCLRFVEVSWHPAVSPEARESWPPQNIGNGDAVWVPNRRNHWPTGWYLLRRSRLEKMPTTLSFELRRAVLRGRGHKADESGLKQQR